ncbi:MAG TPA: hypothetical protein DD412_08190 [Holosporales bacterium]|nr:hypothetical protein [Holosporales bacterium]
MRIFASLFLGLLVLNSPSNASCFCCDGDGFDSEQSSPQKLPSPKKKKASSKEEVVVFGNGAEEGFVVATIDKNGVTYFSAPPNIMSILRMKLWKK